MGPLDRPEEAEGVAFETLLFQELNAINSTLNMGYNIYYWRTSNNMEVDFVLYGSRGIKVFEVKRTGRIRNTMLNGLRAFLRDYPVARAFFIYGGNRRMWEDKIEIIPLHVALQELPDLL